jgi:heptosyltransferase II
MKPHLPGRILVRGTNWLGDAVMTTPALLRLREKFPNGHIALLAPEKLEQLWQNHPAINEVISFAPHESIFAVGQKLRPGKFDTALVLPNSPRSALEVFLARIPNRIGYARPWRNFFLTQTVPARPNAAKMRKRSEGEIKKLIQANTQSGIRKVEFPNSAHQSHEYLHLAAAMGASSEPLAAKLFVAPEEVEAARKKFGLGSISGPLFGLNPGAEYGPAKRWPIERFIAAAKEIQARTNCAWILFGGKNDTEFTNQIQRALGSAPVFNLAGKTSLRELMSLLKLCRIFLTNDTGPMHVAAALDVPVVAIFGSTSPELTGPLALNDSRIQILASDALCSPCFLRECPIDFRCMKGIKVERVVQAVMESLNRTPT